MQQQNRGYVLVLTMLILSLACVMVTYIVRQTSIHIYFDKAHIDRQYAQVMAQNGLHIVLSKLTFCPTQKPEKPKEQFLLHVYPFIHKQITYECDKDLSADLKGTMSVVYGSEEGKINLNMLYDFEKKQFKNEQSKTENARLFIQEVCTRMQQKLKVDNLFKALEKFLKQQAGPLEDVTQLLAIPEFAKAFSSAVFYVPKGKKKLYLCDIFTTWTQEAKLNGAYLSESLLFLFDLQGVDTWRSEKRKEIIEGFLKKGKAQGASQLWDAICKPVYAKEFKALAKTIVPFIDMNLEPSIFNASCFAKIGHIEEKLYCIIRPYLDEKKQKIYMVDRCNWF